MNTFKQFIKSAWKANPVAFIFCVILLFLFIHIGIFHMADNTPGRHRILTEGVKQGLPFDSVYNNVMNYGK